MTPPPEIFSRVRVRGHEGNGRVLGVGPTSVLVGWDTPAGHIQAVVSIADIITSEHELRRQRAADAYACVDPVLDALGLS